MVALAALLQLASAQAGPIKEHLQAAYIDVEALEYCSERSELAAEQFQSHGYDRQFDLENRAWGLFGREVDYVYDYAALPTPKAPSCGDRSVRSIVERINNTWSVVDSWLSEVEARLARGLWVGQFPLCAETVASTHVVGEDGSAVRFVLREEYVDQMRSYTEGFMHDPALRKPLAVRLNGAVILNPTVYEPLSHLQLSPVSQEQVALLVEAAQAQCARL